MLTWARVALILAQLLSQLMTWLREKKLIEQGEAKVIADILAQEAEAINSANKVRKQLDDDFTRDDSSILRHDKYERTKSK